MEVKSNKGTEKQANAPALAGRALPPNPEAEQAAKTLSRWSKLAHRKESNRAQERYLYRIAKADEKSRFLALKAAASLHFCNSRQIVEKVGEHYLPAGAWNCGKKYCAVCSNKKRVKLLRLFTNYFLETDSGKNLLKDYDLAMFTITLQHSKDGLRSRPYYKELSTHFRNALKYGAFRQIIAGGFYNTEHTYTKNGHHIHRHALILIPRRFDVINNYEMLEEQLREQWKSRTGGSFQIQLRPLGFDQKTQSATPRGAVLNNLGAHLLEVTKYITKRDDSGIIDWQIIKAVEEHNRAKFYGRFGILHKVKELKMNQEKEEVEAPTEPGEFYTASIYVKFQKQTKSRKATRRKIQRGKIGKIPFQRVQVIRGETIISWKKDGIRYEAKDLQPFNNTKEARRGFQDSVNISLFKWKIDRNDKLNAGHDVKKWKEQKKALQAWNNIPEFTFKTPEPLSLPLQY